MTGPHGEFIGQFVSQSQVLVGRQVMRMSPRDAMATYRLLGYVPPLH